LPWDVLVLVFKECDPSTLAVLGRANFDFFVGSSPVLYEEIEITTLSGLQQLFCERQTEQRVSFPPFFPPSLLFLLYGRLKSNLQ